MKRRRILTIAVAILLAALGTVAVLAYVHQANTRAVEGLKAVSVIVAQGAIPLGYPGGPGAARRAAGQPEAAGRVGARRRGPLDHP